MPTNTFCFSVICLRNSSEYNPQTSHQYALHSLLFLYIKCYNDSNNLSKITLITFEELVFPDIEQEIVVFIGEKGDEENAVKAVCAHINNQVEAVSDTIRTKK